jgi:DNA-binding HxlR family transcriptional regulator
MAVLDWLGRRWALRVLWELRDGALPFRGLQERCDAVSPTVLNDRLRELRAAGVVDLQDGGGYVLTADGAALGAVLLPLHRWAELWHRRTDARRGHPRVDVRRGAARRPRPRRAP